MKKKKKAAPDTFSFKDLPEEEKQVVVDEIYERWQDMVFMNAKDQIREVFSDRVSLPDTLFSYDDLCITLKLNLVIGDITQVLGRHRRNKLKTGGGK